MNEEDLKCASCCRIFDSDPITLAPCGWVICSSHFRNLDVINCPICSNKHEVSKKLCVFTKSIQMKYAKYMLKEKLRKLESNLDEINQIKKDPVHYINDLFDQKINRIDLQREQAKFMIDNHFDVIFKRIKNIQKESEQKIKLNKKLNEFDDKKYREKIKMVDEAFKKKLSTIEILNTTRDYLEIVKGFEREIDELKSSLTDHKKYDITPIVPFVDCSKLFGRLDITTSNLYTEPEENSTRFNSLPVFSFSKEINPNPFKILKNIPKPNEKQLIKE